MKVTLVIEMDEAKLDAYVRSLYDGEPDDPAPGEPHPGRAYLDEWVTHVRESANRGEEIETMQVDPSNPYVRRVFVSRSNVDSIVVHTPD